MVQELEAVVKDEDYYQQKNLLSLKKANIGLNIIIGAAAASIIYIGLHELIPDLHFYAGKVGSLSDKGIGAYIKDISLTKPFIDSVAYDLVDPLFLGATGFMKFITNFSYHTVIKK
ncbi:MAG: hypothetical protein KC535_03515 [Nanoarchaeota archaeon]|nr:hypothetical protein [Nanoarchaeota archaeon]